jgi:hypothetical protein
MKFDENQALLNTLRRSEVERESMRRQMAFAVILSLAVGGCIGALVMYFGGGC